jgi:hypothetical protein
MDVVDPIDVSESAVSAIDHHSPAEGSHLTRHSVSNSIEQGSGQEIGVRQLYDTPDMEIGQGGQRRIDPIGDCVHRVTGSGKVIC